MLHFVSLFLINRLSLPQSVIFYFLLCSVFQKDNHLDIFRDQDPVVQSVDSLTSLLRVISLTVLADSIHNILILFAEKM